MLERRRAVPRRLQDASPAGSRTPPLPRQIRAPPPALRSLPAKSPSRAPPPPRQTIAPVPLLPQRGAASSAASRLPTPSSRQFPLLPQRGAAGCPRPTRCGGRTDHHDPSSPGSWGQDVRPPGGFMSFFANEAQNSHLVGAPIHSSPLNEAVNAASTPDVELLHDNDNASTEKRIMWNVDEEVRLMSAWIEHSTDATCGADKGGGQYWSEVVATYNKTTPPHRRSAKQCKDRWHKVNKLTDLFECSYVKARRVFTSGYSNEQWMEAAHRFYLEDNKDNKDVVGPFMLEKVWKICRDVPKWKTYNEMLKNARKRKSFHLEGDSEENEDNVNEMPERPIGQKAAKKAALAAKNGKLNGSSSSDDGNSKDSPIELDKFERYSKFQETNTERRMKMLDRQEKIASDKLEATRIAQLIAQDYREGKKLEKETKMMETYNNLATQDTSLMTDEEKAQRLSMLKKLEKALFPE